MRRPYALETIINSTAEEAIFPPYKGTVHLEPGSPAEGGGHRVWHQSTPIAEGLGKSDGIRYVLRSIVSSAFAIRTVEKRDTSFGSIN